MYKLQFLLIINTIKNNIELKSKQRWYYFKLPKQISKGFTLAEILITLLVVGIVASISIPALINDMQNMHYKVAYKKAFAVASQAWQSAVNNNEIIVTGRMNNTTASANFNTFKNYFKVTKECPAGSGISQCWTDGEKFDWRPDSNAPGFIDASGMLWTIGTGTWNYILVDTNGFGKPNKFGRDRFMFLCRASDNSGDGLPIKIGVYQDYKNIDEVWCPSGGCYYRSWLSQ